MSESQGIWKIINIMGTVQQPWEQIVSQKRAIREKLLAPYLVDIEHRVPRVDHVDYRTRLEDEPEVQRITDMDLTGLLKRLEVGEFTAHQVIQAYIKRYDKISER
jgi:hypothetical protein